MIIIFRELDIADMIYFDFPLNTWKRQFFFTHISFIKVTLNSSDIEVHVLNLGHTTVLCLTILIYSNTHHQGLTVHDSFTR